MGFSGVGKSHFCKYISDKNNWFYFLIDKWSPSINDGLECYDLMKEWELLIKHNNPSQLINKIIKIINSANKQGGVFDFPSVKMLSVEHIALLRKFVKVVYFAADPKFCIDSCYKRSRMAGTTFFGDAHWYKFNNELLNLLNDERLKLYCINVLNNNKERKSIEEIYSEIKKMDCESLQLLPKVRNQP